MMTNRHRPRSAFEKWLHENHLTFRDAGVLFGCSREWVRKIASGEVEPDASSEIGQRILKALTAHEIPSLPVASEVHQ